MTLPMQGHGGGCTYSIHRLCSRWGDGITKNFKVLKNIVQFQKNKLIGKSN